MRKRKDFLAMVEEKYGKDVFIREYLEGFPSISTGSMAIDISTGIGGIPRGRFTEIYGPEQSGKTTLVLCTAREALKLGLKVLIIDVENSLDFLYATEIIGKIEPSNCAIIQPESAEDAFDIALAGIESNFGLILFDSIGAISPSTELDQAMEKQFIGTAPRLTNKFLRKSAFNIRTKGISFVFTNQVRANIGSFFGGFSTPAGYALRHYASLILFLTKSSAIKDGDTVIGHEVNFVIQKNKLAQSGGRSAKTCITGINGIDYLRDTLMFSSLLGVTATLGSHYKFGDINLGQGTEKTIKFLRENPDVLDKIQGMCYNIAGVKYPPIRELGLIEDLEEENEEDTEA